MPTALRSRRTARRDEVLSGLIDLFLAEGFSGFSVEDLAARLQCSKSTLYAVAPSKEQLITAVVRAFFRRSTDRVEASLAEENVPAARLGTYLDAIAGELGPASPAFYADLDAYTPAREIYERNTAIAARRVHELVRETQRPGRTIDAAFLGAITAQVMASIQQGQIRALTGMDDAAAYRALADLLAASVGSSVRQPTAG
jgi:AcrR family transcriptional regulator